MSNGVSPHTAEDRAIIFGDTTYDEEPVWHLPGYLRSSEWLDEHDVLVTVCGIHYGRDYVALQIRHAAAFARLCQRCARCAGLQD